MNETIIPDLSGRPASQTRILDLVAQSAGAGAAHDGRDTQAGFHRAFGSGGRVVLADGGVKRAASRMIVATAEALLVEAGRHDRVAQQGLVTENVRETRLTGELRGRLNPEQTDRGVAGRRFEHAIHRFVDEFSNSLRYVRTFVECRHAEDVDRGWLAVIVGPLAARHNTEAVALPAGRKLVASPERNRRFHQLFTRDPVNQGNVSA